MYSNLTGFTEVVDDATDNDFTFSTREYSDVSGLGHWPVREYDPFIGRWTIPDPAGIVDGLNLYNFVNANPVSAYDLLGLVTFKSCYVKIAFGHNTIDTDKDYWAFKNEIESFISPKVDGNSR